MNDVVEIEANGYSVFIGELSDFSLKDYITSRYDLSDTYILVDENTEQACLPNIQTIFGNDGVFGQIEKISIQSGEQNKTIDTVTSIAKKMSASNASRNALLINLGGGVLCDIGGFAASIYKRGIDFINIPTTLLSQVDASIGGKVGVDLGGLKNYLGVFSNPKAVYVSPDFISTLEKREITAGFAEVIKHGLIADKDYLEVIMAHGLEYSSQEKESWTSLIRRSIEIKNQIVLEDPMEKGKRKILNFGHTVGHAVETFFLNTEKPLLHGEAIAIGMICECYLSKICAGLQEKTLETIVEFILSIFGTIKLDPSIHTDLLKLMAQDKKNHDGKTNFTLIKDIGEPIIDQYANQALIMEALGFYTDLASRQ